METEAKKEEEKKMPESAVSLFAINTLFGIFADILNIEVHNGFSQMARFHPKKGNLIASFLAATQHYQIHSQNTAGKDSLPL